MTFKPTVLAMALAACLSTSVQAAPELPVTGLDTGSSQYNTANAWVEIDQAAFEHNISTLQTLLDGKSRICAIMKADAYGHGIANLMPSVMAANIPCVGITSNEEARVVRQSGYEGRILRVRSASPQEVSDGLQYEMEELFGDIDAARTAAKIAGAAGKTLRYHLGLNAGGMSRNGLEVATEEGKQEARELLALDNLELVGIMTHFQYEDADFVRAGLAKFNEQSQWLIEDGKLDRSKLTLHTANSFTTLEVPEARLDMVRPGGIIYGDTIPSYTEYKKVMSFKTRVASINNYPAGNLVGYDGTYSLKRDSLLANLPMGYSDGYRRVFTNKAYVVVNGHRAPVVGKVSMNTTMIDVTDIPGVKPGDEVVLFGKQGDAEVTQGELEDANGALLADLYTVWGNSNPKILKRIQ
ncbi:alanine racemase [Oceanisphaera psychrotolerans]|uniref:Broad specificity amino-acid racemase n=1 Tax=Oceanisphaera psychrotolerans TaxID=1414654 RepID=A0A1J4QDT6_9GAMM|nr:alanine racemase [Oceanisphaera psychrotolerans]OIN09222.1 alanine racemase [Oceanisphaera psychrotolerans]